MKLSEDWIEDCIFYWGKILDGGRAHWCPEFDFLPIDDTCEMEISCCTCTLREDNK